jgi:hypothetical protein
MGGIPSEYNSVGAVMRRISIAVLSFALLAGAPSELWGQAVCSAPHSSPTLAQSGAIRTLPAGAGWIQLSLYRQRSGDFYNPLGDRQPFLAQSEFLTRSVFVTGAVGLVEGLELWAQVPTHRLGVESQSGGSTSSGVGDVRVAARIGPELFGLEIPVAVRVGAKVPGSDFPVDATVLPLTEGQRDWEVSLESGRGFDDFPLYVSGWVGYRWRGENVAAARKPGNERFAHLAVGGSLGALSWEVGADGLWGTAPLASGILLSQDLRRLIQILPTLGYGVGPGRLEVTTQIPVSGRNLPFGVGLSVGYRTTWGL